jgi:hypothetical protein
MATGQDKPKSGPPGVSDGEIIEITSQMKVVKLGNGQAKVTLPDGQTFIGTLISDTRIRRGPL